MFFGLTLLTSTFGSYLMYDILSANGLTALKFCGLPLFFVLFAWITGAFWTAVAGFIVQLIGRDPAALHLDDGVHRPPCGRTALIMPIP